MVVAVGWRGGEGIGGFRWITTKVTNACIPCLLGVRYTDIGIHSVHCKVGLTD